MSKTLSRDYWNYDYISLTAKVKTADEVVDAYNDFGWEEIDRFADKRYIDVLHLSFRRSRNVKNKDEMQYLQVCYERLINKRTEYEYKRHDRSNIVLSLLMVLCIGLAFVGAVAVYNARSYFTLVWAWCAIGIGFLGITPSLFLVKKMRKKEKLKFKERKQEIDEQIEKTLAKAIKIAGEADEK